MPDDLVTWAEIDLDAIQSNLRAIRRHIGDGPEIIAVVKANAYGHGAVPVGRAVLQAGAARLAVHRAVEGIELRQAGLDAPILVMGYTPPAAAGRLVDHRLTPSLTTAEFARALSERSLAAGRTTPVHLKVDTGMSRYGLMPEEVLAIARLVKDLPGLELEGLFTHFATSDWADQTFVRQQLKTFEDVLAALGQAGISVPVIHASNSGAIQMFPESHLTAVRPGIILYGLKASDQWQPAFPLQPALSLKSRLSRVREVPAGAGISYGRTVVTSRPTRVGLVPVGYGDGYHRALSNKGIVLVRGQRAPILGRVCMDQFVIDVSAVPGAQQDDEVVLVGAQGEDAITADEIARLLGTINYEVTTSLLPRVTRVYRQGGEWVGRSGLGEEDRPAGPG